MADKLLDPCVERLLMRGPGALTDAEIVSILLRKRGSRIPTLEQAQSILTLFGGGIPGLLACNVAIAEAQKLSPEPAANLLAAIELGRRLPTFPELVELHPDPKMAASAFLVQIGTTDQEVLSASFTDAAGRKVGSVECFRGTMSHMVIDSKTILREALCRNARGIHLFHFKPGSTKPEATSQDLGFLVQMREACETLGFELLDYLLFSTSNWLSLRRLYPW